MAKRYTISDGKLVLVLEEALESGFVVTSPLDPGLITEAENIADAFQNASDAIKALRLSRSRKAALDVQVTHSQGKTPCPAF